MIHFSKSYFFGAVILLATQVFAADNSQLKDPEIAIIGCGHGNEYTDGDHSHSEMICFNVEKDPMHGDRAGNSPEAFKEKIKYDEKLDIKTPHQEIKKKGTYYPIRDSQPEDEGSNKIIRYKNKFKVVVFERAWSENLRRPWTIWNMANMCDVNGNLIFDTTCGYDSSLYTASDSPFKADGPIPSYEINQCQEKLQEFGILGKRVTVNTDMQGISDYLAFWGFKDIINVMEAYQPYTKIPSGTIETARKTRILSARKTQETEDRMESWAQSIYTVRGHLFISEGTLKPEQGRRMPQGVLALVKTSPIETKSASTIVDVTQNTDNDRREKSPQIIDIAQPVALTNSSVIQLLPQKTLEIPEKVLRNSFSEHLRIMEEKHRAAKEKWSNLFNTITPSHQEHVTLLHANLERNKKAIEWIDQELRWSTSETTTGDRWTLMALQAAFQKISRIRSTEDGLACKKANQYMRNEINEWVDSELAKKLADHGFNWDNAGTEAPPLRAPVTVQWEKDDIDWCDTGMESSSHPYSASASVTREKEVQSPKETRDTSGTHSKQFTYQNVVFKAPTVEEIKKNALGFRGRALKPFSFISNEIIYKSVIYPFNDNEFDFIRRASDLKAYHATYLIHKPGSNQKRIVFAYSRDGGQGIELQVDFESMGVDSLKANYATDKWMLNTAPGYFTAFNPDLEIKIN